MRNLTTIFISTLTLFSFGCSETRNGSISASNPAETATETLNDQINSDMIHAAISPRGPGVDEQQFFASASSLASTMYMCVPSATETCSYYPKGFEAASASVLRNDVKIFAFPTTILPREGLGIAVLAVDKDTKTIAKATLRFQAVTSGSSDDFESTPTSFKLTSYWLPSPDQLGAGSCLYMSATGIMEFLINQSRSLKRPVLEGESDVSEEFTLTLSSSVALTSPYTDAVDLFKKYGGFVASKDLPFKAYATSSWISGTGVNLNSFNLIRSLPPYGKRVLFSAGGEGTQRQQNVMKPEDLDAIKAALRQHRAPVLFVFQPTGASYWHANMIIGFDDIKKTLLTRDSSFGEKLTSIGSFPYDGYSPWGPQPYRGLYELGYKEALVWGNHATVYFLDGH